MTARSSRATVSAAVVELVAYRRELAAYPFDLVGACPQLLLAVAKLDDLRRDLLPFVLDFGFELGDGLDGGCGRADAVHPDLRVLRCT